MAFGLNGGFLLGYGEGGRYFAWFGGWDRSSYVRRVCFLFSLAFHGGAVWYGRKIWGTGEEEVDDRTREWSVHVKGLGR